MPLGNFSIHIYTTKCEAAVTWAHMSDFHRFWHMYRTMAPFSGVTPHLLFARAVKSSTVN